LDTNEVTNVFSEPTLKTRLSYSMTVTLCSAQIFGLYFSRISSESQLNHLLQITCICKKVVAVTQKQMSFICCSES